MGKHAPPTQSEETSMRQYPALPLVDAVHTQHLLPISSEKGPSTST